MKNRHYYLLLLPLFGLLSCSNNNPDWSEQYKEASFYVVQFEPTAFEYMSNVMLVPNSKGEYRMRSLQNGGTCKEFFLFHSPFMQVDTTQHWFLADWKWGLYLSKAHSVLQLQWKVGTHVRRYLNRPSGTRLSQSVFLGTGYTRRD